MAEVLGTYVLGTDEIPVLEIGVQSENQAVEIKFDYTAWHELYGDGDIGIMLLRKGDEQAFPAILTTEQDEDGNYIATWVVDAVATANIGSGKAQLAYIAGTQVKKTIIFRFVIKKSLYSGDPIDYLPVVVLDEEFIYIENRLGLPHPVEPPLVVAILNSELIAIEERLEDNDE
jgi:hypothetical protein